MAHVELEYESPEEIVFKKKCFYCRKSSDLKYQFYIEEDSKIGRILDRPWLGMVTLFLITVLLLALIIPQHLTFALALVLSYIIWVVLKLFAKKSFKKLFRYATAYICIDCMQKWKRVKFVEWIYGGVIFTVLLIWIVWGFLYDPETVPLFIVGICIFGIFFGGAIIDFLENIFFRHFGLNAPELLLMKQGLISGTTKLTMLEEDFTQLVEQKTNRENLTS